jgi:2-polyprenyl-3-methyl-5-hydroxy-6-metoxy-1,4-benzoquinol methylase
MLEIGQEMPMNVATLTGARPTSPEAPTTSADLAAIKARQHAAWSSGDYAVVGTTLQIVGEELCEALDLRSGRKVLDVAAGNGMVSLAAARRWCDVISTDYVASLLERGRARALAEGLPIEFRVADAEALPFDDGAFDTVVSTFGVMFTPNQDRAARSSCAFAGRAARLVLRTGRRTALSATCSRRSENTSRLRRRRSLRCSGARARV